ncbi:hypothetical protein Pmani_011278 [Petrolisthes manimaculis]|uniref:C2H2-type domain-containing protein n=1 Tax=Petrolisthes manimaculis TaxID=1843537 RepID=A0AAE1PZS3_9EUCA|nr:hypothetical protein Pmani_011278 [Petrolisthes manimaculis]
MRGGRSPRPAPRPGPTHRRSDPEKLLAALGPDAQLALTTALINTVLKTSEDKQGQGSFREGGREGQYRHREPPHREGRGGGYFKEEIRPRRQYNNEAQRGRYESRWSEDGGRRGGGQHHHHIDRDRSGFQHRPQHHRYGNKYQQLSHGNKRRPSSPPHAYPGPNKRQRSEMNEAERSPHGSHHLREGEDISEDEESGEDSHSNKWSWKKDGERRSRTSPGMERSQREGTRRSGSESGGGAGGKDSEGGGVQVTIRADGERAVNSDGHVRRVAGRLFVELHCPHCPSQKSITFKEYKLHLTSDLHKSQLSKLARKHTVVLRKIRLQQRQEQKEIEDKWREDNPDEFKTSVSRFCNTCKLAFKSLRSSGVHNRSKLHRMQRHYLRPRCGLCRITFPSRMVYEHHIASINHLRVRTANLDNQVGEGSGEKAKGDQHAREEDCPDDLDLANFMTVDSVGEDDEEEGSEHEEITGGLEAVKAAEKEAATGDDSEEEMEDPIKGGVWDEDEDVGPLIDTDWDKEQPDEEEEESGHKPMGTDYVRRVEAYYCSLCRKIIRLDSTLGSRVVQRHCRSLSHLTHYWDHHPTSHQDEDEYGNKNKEDDDDIDEEDIAALGMDMDPDQEKLWDKVDHSLSELSEIRGKILTEIEGETRKGSEEEPKTVDVSIAEKKESPVPMDHTETEKDKDKPESEMCDKDVEDSKNDTTNSNKTLEEVGDDVGEELRDIGHDITQ